MARWFYFFSFILVFFLFIKLSFFFFFFFSSLFFLINYLFISGYESDFIQTIFSFLIFFSQSNKRIFYLSTFIFFHLFLYFLSSNFNTLCTFKALFFRVIDQETRPTKRFSFQPHHTRGMGLGSNKLLS